MRIHRALQITTTCLLLAGMSAGSAYAAKRRPAPVPPSLEIEVLDPGVDPLGNPKVMVDDLGDYREIDIPPVVLVHRYYYTGDRSFQAQILPGGPSIVVVNHPKTGERTYIPVQMLPGAPRVTYTGHTIEYDYGQNGITICFGLLGRPKVKYRSGVSLPRRLGNLVHAEPLCEKAASCADSTKDKARRSAYAAYGAAAVATDTAKKVVTPVCAVAQSLPFGKMIFSGDLGQRLATRGAEHKRDSSVRKTTRQAEFDEATIRTVR